MAETANGDQMHHDAAADALHRISLLDNLPAEANDLVSPRHDLSTEDSNFEDAENNGGEARLYEEERLPNGLQAPDQDREEGRESGAGEQTSSTNREAILSIGLVSESNGGQPGEGYTVSGKEGFDTSQLNQVSKHLATNGTSINESMLYNIALGDEEGHSRQRILSFAAKRYASAVERNPEDYDALYNWALVLQESADNIGSDSNSPLKDQLLEEACKKYQGATKLCPTLHEAFYNWAIAISDRAKSRGRTKEAEDLWKQACKRYEKAVQLNWSSPQALNNWGLALQELSGIVPIKNKKLIVKTAIKKFRVAIQLQFDFHRAIYNLGTVLYGLAEDTYRFGRIAATKNSAEPDLYSQSAIYIAIAHALKPDYPVYRSALRLVHSMLPLPYLKTGYLTVSPGGRALSPHGDWKTTLFVLDHEALYQIETDEQTPFNPNSSTMLMGMNSGSSSVVGDIQPVFRIEIAEIASVFPCADLSLPQGEGFCIDTASGEQYLIADTWEAVDSWVDAIRLAYTVYYRGHSDILAGILAG